jgi:hypothetical protein
LINKIVFSSFVDFTNILQKAFFPFPFATNLQRQTVTTEKCQKHFCTKKGALKMLVTLISGVNFAIILEAYFTRSDPKSAQTNNLTVFLRFWDLRT